MIHGFLIGTRAVLFIRVHDLTASNEGCVCDSQPARSKHTHLQKPRTTVCFEILNSADHWRGPKLSCPRRRLREKHKMYLVRGVIEL